MLFDFILPGSKTPKTDPHPNIGLFPGLVKTDPAKAEAEQQRLEQLYEHAVTADAEWAELLQQATDISQQPEELLDILEELDVTPEPADTITAQSEDVPPPLPQIHPLDEIIRRYIHRTEIAKPNFAASFFPEYPYQKMLVDIVYPLLEENEDKGLNPNQVIELLNLFSRGKEHQQAGLVIGQGLIARNHPITANIILETILLCENQDQNIHQNTKINLITNNHLEPTYAENLLNSIINEDPAFTTEFNEDIFEPCLLHYLNDHSQSSAAHFLLGQYYLKQAKQTKDPNCSEKAATHLLTSIKSTNSLIKVICYSIEENNYLQTITEHAKILRDNKKIDQAIVTYQLLNLTQPSNHHHHYFLATCYEQKGELETAKEQYILAGKGSSALAGLERVQNQLINKK